MRCRCVWANVRCPNEATQEDGLCDWCGDRRPEDLVNNPKAMFDPDGKYLGLGGAGEAHVDPGCRPDACWMPNSGRSLSHIAPPATTVMVGDKDGNRAAPAGDAGGPTAS